MPLGLDSPINARTWLFFKAILNIYLLKEKAEKLRKINIIYSFIFPMGEAHLGIQKICKVLHT